jgi:hypothetical protein
VKELISGMSRESVVKELISGLSREPAVKELIWFVTGTCSERTELVCHGNL